MLRRLPEATSLMVQRCFGATRTSPESSYSSDAASSQASLSKATRGVILAHPCSSSRRPISTRSGVPRRSLANRRFPRESLPRAEAPPDAASPPGPESDFASVSIVARTPPRLRACTSARPAAVAACSASPFPTASTSTWWAATAGGATKPTSSECDMMAAPSRRVDTPHDVAHTGRDSPSASLYLTPKASEKAVPRKCDVPDCRAHPSCIMASMVSVASAPAKRSEGVFSPMRTGTAMQERTTSP
mmetsp:Transcript_461/g.1718  ORF Transcript_461/g.1718 Transcript_461/m.1718 type:complete len:246 (-) Transcript_461:715-1452(-)